jgi:hypothetical protein
MTSCSIREVQGTRQHFRCLAAICQLGSLWFFVLRPLSCFAGGEDQQYTLQFEEKGSANPMMEMLMKVLADMLAL